MKHYRKGFIAPLLIILIAVSAVGVGFYVHDKNEEAAVVTAITPKIQIAAPTTDESVVRGKPYTIKWSSVGITAPIKITLFYGSNTQINPVSTSIVLNTANTGSYAWQVPSTLAVGSYEIVASSLAAKSSQPYSGNVYFNIVASPLPPEPPYISSDCIDGKASNINIEWADAGQGAQGYHVDITPNSTFNSGGYDAIIPASQRYIDIKTGETSTVFTAFSGAKGHLTLVPGKNYTVRIYYVSSNVHGPTVIFKVPLTCGQSGIINS